MSSRNTNRESTAYRLSHPTFSAPPALAKETVYMPSRLASLVLGRGPSPGVVIRDGGEAHGPASRWLGMPDADPLHA